MSCSIFFRRSSSTKSEIRIHNIPTGTGFSVGLSYTVISISLALSTSMSWPSSSHLSFRVDFVLTRVTSSTLMITNVSGPRVKREVVAWSTSFTASTRTWRRPVKGRRMFGALMLSSGHQLA